MGLANIISRVMVPESSNKESDVADNIMEWEKELEEVISIDASYKLPDPYKKAALNMILMGKIKKTKRTWTTCQ